MKLVTIESVGSSKVLTFTKSKSDGFILESIKVTVNQNKRVLRIELQELKFGLCAFGPKGKLVYCEAWEQEEDAQSKSALSKHFTSILTKENRDTNYAKKIYENLDQSLEDNYLRYVLKEFIQLKKNVKFEADYYQIKPNLVNELLDLEGELPKEDNKEKIIDETFETKSMSFLQKLKSNPTKVGLSIFGILMISYFLLQYGLEKYNENPANWPQPTSFRMQDSTSVPKGYIFRHRDYPKILKSNLFPTLSYLEKSISDVIQEHHKNFSNYELELQKKTLKTPSYKTQDLLDQIYPLDKEEQVLIFHHELIQPGQLNPLEIALFLNSFYTQNLTRLVYQYSSDPAVFISDYLDGQTNKESLLKYLLYLIRKFPDSEISVEALLAIESIFQIQQNAIIYLVDSVEKGICKFGNEDEKNSPLQKLVCKVNTKYKVAENAYTKENMTSKYTQFRMGILNYVVLHNQNQYRLNDIKFRKFQLLLSDSRYLEAVAEFKSISTQDNYGLFVYQENFKQIASVVKEDMDRIPILIEKKEKSKKEMNSLRNDLVVLEKKAEGLDLDISKMISKMKLENVNEEYLKILKSREEALLYLEK